MLIVEVGRLATLIPLVVLGRRRRVMGAQVTKPAALLTLGMIAAVITALDVWLLVGLAIG